MVVKSKGMKPRVLTVCCLAAFLSISAAQFETGNDQVSKPWFWNSTTTSTDSLTEAEAEKKVPSTTPSTISEIEALVTATKNVSEEPIFSPTLLDGFLPANITNGRSAVLADLFSDDFAPANVTRGRSNKALNLDLIGNVREGRIINDDPGNRRLSLQGFIPIVSFAGKENDDDEDGKRSAVKSPKRSEDDDLYYKGPYPPIPIDNEEQTKSHNYYIPSPEPPKNSRYGYEKAVDSNKQDRYGERIQEVKHANNDFYIPPQQSQVSPHKANKDRYVVVPDKDAVRYISADDYHKRPTYSDAPQNFHQDATKSESQAAGHFIVSSKPSKDDEDDVQYAQAGPYPPQPLPTNERYPAKDTTAKQYAPGGKQFDQEGIYELSNGNYILNTEGGGHNGEEKCICVPFYLCRNGYLNNYGRSLERDPIDERSARKERSVGNETDLQSSTLPPYTEDIMARMIGLGNVGDSCGLLRRCCKVPHRGAAPGGLLPFSPDNYPIPQPDFSNLPPGLLPPGISIQQVPGNPEQAYIINQGGYPNQGGYQNQGYPGQPQEQQIVLVPQQEGPHRPPLPHRRPRPIQPPPVAHPIRPQYPSTNRPNPNRSIRPIYPQRRPQQPQNIYPQEQPVYQPQQSYPKPQPAYPPHGLRPPKPLYPDNDYNEHRPQVHQGQCGARNGFGIHGRVNNLQYQDDASEFGEYPWQAAILLKVGPGNNLFVCGGTLISNTWVATAAHCLKKHQADELKVRLGDWDVHRDDEFYPYVEKFVVEAVPHPDFYPGNLQNDLALLRLDSPIDSSSPHISPACLPELNERFDKLRCWVTGWGKNAFGEQGEYQSVLKEVDVPMLSHRDCEHRLKQTRLGRSYQLHPGFLCAGGEPGKDACTGDGGSPLVCEHGGTWKVAGLVSWGIGCGQPGVPGIYVNIAKYRSWIDTVIGRYG